LLFKVILVLDTIASAGEPDSGFWILETGCWFLDAGKIVIKIKCMIGSCNYIAEIPDSIPSGGEPDAGLLHKSKIVNG